MAYRKSTRRGRSYSSRSRKSAGSRRVSRSSRGRSGGSTVRVVIETPSMARPDMLSPMQQMVPARKAKF